LPVPDELTEDSLLGGAVRFSQPAHGYRVAIDPVLLAAAVPAAAGDRVLDAGAGTGAASLCLAARVPDCRIVGVEIERALARIASHNIEQNGRAAQVEVITGNLDPPPPRLSGASFDHVMTNPPHLAPGDAPASPVPGRALAHHESELDLARWLAGCMRMLKPGGRLTLIHRADRLTEILAALAGTMGDLVLFPLWPASGGRPAKRILVQGRRGARGKIRLMRGLVLHQPDGSYSGAATAVLRHAEALALADEVPSG
jgi:tRNA1(Val) A37 N6-methylase TrmN6